MSALNVEHVSKHYGKLKAVDELNFQVQEGQIFGLLGPNGAGKSSTIRMVMDIIRPDSGKIELFGQANTVKARDNVGYLPEERGLYKKMPVLDVILFFAEMKSRSPKQVTDKAEHWLERLDLLDWKDKKVEELSRGMQQKLQFIITILHEPKLIILDEPFTGLDPVNTALVKDVMLELKQQGTAIIFSTHLMEQVEKLCQAICLINKGKSVLTGSLKDVKAKFGANRIRMRYDGAADFLNNSALVQSFDDYGQYVEIHPADNVTSQDVLKTAMQQVSVQHFEVSEPSLNDIFINIVTAKGGEA